MKRLILSLALLVVVLSAPYVMAGGGNGSFELQKAWNAEQAQQQRINAEFSKIDRDAARTLSGTSASAKQKAGICQPIQKDQIRTCMNCQE
jgi:hypothetical protein